MPQEPVRSHGTRYHVGVLLRTLRSEDMPGLLALSDSAGWNQTPSDWDRLLRLWPEGCLGIEADGRMAASATVAMYGGTLAWIGMVLTLPEYRGQGMARKLMGAALDLCGDAAVRLDASDMGKPLYEQLGFISECPVERWRRDPAASGASGLVEPLGSAWKRDPEVFGADRSALLEDLALLEAASSGSAYAFARPGARASYFGPCISDTERNARALLGWFLGNHSEETVVWDLFPHSRAAAVAAEFGFRPVRTLTRMVRRPRAAELPDPRIWGIAGFEIG